MAQQEARKKMTAEEAIRFERYSVGNAVLLKAALDCGCEPYRDVFTFRRWLAQGFGVQKGQKAVRLALVSTGTKTDEETGEITTFRRLGSSAVFCRCQVREVTR